VSEPAWKLVLEKQQYRVVGEHTAVKTCHWLKQSLLQGRTCYKQRFYGIDSHRCLQMTPTVNNCNQKCLFCWRYQEWEAGAIVDPDDPKEMLEGSIAAQQNLITGYKGNPKADPEKWKEANEPKHLALSLTGEPTFYPRLGEFLKEIHEAGMTSFLVTNGTTPGVLRALDPLPTQLYISVDAPNEKVFRDLCVPMKDNLWESHLRSLDVMRERGQETRTVIRHTLVQGYNMEDGHLADYASLIQRGRPMFVEAKGYVFVGDSRQRMTINAMPSHDTVKAFAERLAELTGYTVADEHPSSRVVLLLREDLTREDAYLPGRGPTVQ